MKVAEAKPDAHQEQAVESGWNHVAPAWVLLPAANAKFSFSADRFDRILTTLVLGEGRGISGEATAVGVASNGHG